MCWCILSDQKIQSKQIDWISFYVGPLHFTSEGRTAFSTLRPAGWARASLDSYDLSHNLRNDFNLTSHLLINYIVRIKQ